MSGGGMGGAPRRIWGLMRRTATSRSIGTPGRACWN